MSSDESKIYACDKQTNSGREQIFGITGLRSIIDDTYDVILTMNSQIGESLFVQVESVMGGVTSKTMLL